MIDQENPPRNIANYLLQPCAQKRITYDSIFFWLSVGADREALLP